jgi:hypothetical protein
MKFLFDVIKMLGKFSFKVFITFLKGGGKMELEKGPKVKKKRTKRI